MTQYWRVQAALTNDSGEPHDSAVNTWHFTSDEVGTKAEDVQDITDKLTAFYGDISGYLSNNLDGGIEYNCYALLDAPERVPHEETGLLGPLGGGDALPQEVAACLSYRAAFTPGVRRSRRRGRLFIGPLSQGGVRVDGNGDMRVDFVFRDALGLAANDLRLAFEAPAAPLRSQITWCLHSRTTYLEVAPPGVENDLVALGDSFFPVTGGRIDNAFDIQRRRGRVADAFTFWGAGWV